MRDAGYMDMMDDKKDTAFVKVGSTNETMPPTKKPRARKVAAPKTVRERAITLYRKVYPQVQPGDCVVSKARTRREIIVRAKDPSFGLTHRWSYAGATLKPISTPIQAS